MVAVVLRSVDQGYKTDCVFTSYITALKCDGFRRKLHDCGAAAVVFAQRNLAAL